MIRRTRVRVSGRFFYCLMIIFRRVGAREEEKLDFVVLLLVVNICWPV